MLSDRLLSIGFDLYFDPPQEHAYPLGV
jgi:hypothetical protein